MIESVKDMIDIKLVFMLMCVCSESGLHFTKQQVSLLVKVTQKIRDTVEVDKNTVSSLSKIASKGRQSSSPSTSSPSSSPSTSVPSDLTTVCLSLKNDKDDSESDDDEDDADEDAAEGGDVSGV